MHKILHLEGSQAFLGEGRVRQPRTFPEKINREKIDHVTLPRSSKVMYDRQ